MDSIDWDEIERKCNIFIDAVGPLPPIERDFDIIPYVKRINQNSNDLLNFIDSITFQLKDKKNLSILLLVVVFSSIEGGFTFWIDTLCYQLIRKGHHDLWDDLKHSFISTFDEVTRIRLAVKMAFLKLHGLDFIDRFVHKELRNAFAHQNYSIDDDGTVILYKNRNRGMVYSINDLKEIHESMRRLMETMVRLFASKIGMEFDDLKEIFQSLSPEDFETIGRKIMDEQKSGTRTKEPIK